MIDLFDWIEAANAFVKYGDIEELSNKLKETNRKIWKSGIAKPKKLDEFAGKLKILSDQSRLTYVPLLAESGRKIFELLSKDELRQEIMHFVKPLNLLSANLSQFANQFKKDSIWQSHLQASKWYLEKKQPTQSLLVLRETIVSYLCEQKEEDPYNLEKRKQAEKYLNNRRRKSTGPLIKLWQRITEERNLAGHALMKKTHKHRSPHKSLKKVESLLKETEKLLRTE